MISLSNNRVLILGHTGMLGTAVYDFLSSRNREVHTAVDRWPSKALKKQIKQFDGVIINCAGAIPQQGLVDYSINWKLPAFLISNNKRFIQPCTDCIYSGDIPPSDFYSIDQEPDAKDDYGKSKARFAKMASTLEGDFKVIRSSIIGFDKNEVSLLSWFLNHASKNSQCNGYLNHIWNGITTLQWARIADHVLHYWAETPELIVPSTKPISKHQLLNYIAEVFDVDIYIDGIFHEKNKNKSLESNFVCQDIVTQLIDLQKAGKHNEKNLC